MGGESKRKRDIILTRFPFCIYCGGTTPATTLDHAPPRIMFELKQRPSGLEFPACAECNARVSIDEMVAGIIARSYPDGTTSAARDEVRRLWKAIANNCPGLLEELWPTYRQVKLARRWQDTLPSMAGALNARGPLLNKSMHRFAAKLGFALHFELVNKALPPGGAACVWWLTNHEFLDGNVPQRLTDMVGAPRTLSQGRWRVGDQFSYGSVGTPEGTMSAHFATFRFSFAICAFVAEDAEKVRPPVNIGRVTYHRPGWLREV